MSPASDLLAALAGLLLLGCLVLAFLTPALILQAVRLKRPGWRRAALAASGAVALAEAGMLLWGDWLTRALLPAVTGLLLLLGLVFALVAAWHHPVRGPR
ncbi:hypothetical protein JYK14_18240 [Siccirubricoccus sp. KC 17139]|uniref:Uncharacterized protein n=1 Tax=Siccirubricoccus soli TaxID=2899147 RepID=A0ABT1D828_9PROT|nr:hypothetical protein [Siccirubricoccus soli]MCO6418087.1 hypothetical protein [Siccirubricoccus soli]MCP2684222.1 hypothetical protein [Siccirubricoccus soli]